MWSDWSVVGMSIHFDLIVWIVPAQEQVTSAVYWMLPLTMWKPNENLNWLSRAFYPTPLHFNPGGLLSVFSTQCSTERAFSNKWLYLVGTVVLFHPGLQANMQVELILLVVACPCHFFKAIGLGVDELGVLGDGLVWVPDKKKRVKEFFMKEFPERWDLLMLSGQNSTRAHLKQ